MWPLEPRLVPVLWAVRVTAAAGGNGTRRQLMILAIGIILRPTMYSRPVLALSGDWSRPPRRLVKRVAGWDGPYLVRKHLASFHSSKIRQ